MMCHLIFTLLLPSLVEMRRDLTRLGIPTGLTILPQAPHAFLNQQRPFDLCVETCDAFFTLHLKPRR